MQGNVSSDVGRRLEETEGVLRVPDQACIGESSASAPLATTIGAPSWATILLLPLKGLKQA